MASGPRPITKAEMSGIETPSLLSRAGSPVQPLATGETMSRQQSRDGIAALRGDLRLGEFIGSVDCGTT